jgi:hypothetical protein
MRCSKKNYFKVKKLNALGNLNNKFFSSEIDKRSSKNGSQILFKVTVVFLTTINCAKCPKEKQ